MFYKLRNLTNFEIPKFFKSLKNYQNRFRYFCTLYCFTRPDNVCKCVIRSVPPHSDNPSLEVLYICYILRREKFYEPGTFSEKKKNKKTSF